MKEDFYELRKEAYEKEEAVYICELDGKEFSSLTDAKKYLLNKKYCGNKSFKVSSHKFYFCETEEERTEVNKTLGRTTGKSVWEGPGWYDKFGDHLSVQIQKSEEELNGYKQGLQRLKEAKNGKY